MENEILKIATDKIDELESIECKILKVDLQHNNKLIDAEIAITHNDDELKYFVETKKKIVPDQIPKIIDQVQDLSTIMYLADYITPKAKEILRLKNIPYADTAGNIYLNAKNVYIYIQTEKTNRKKIKTHTRAFNKAGLKVLFQLLRNPEYLNKPYRFIGNEAKVTIATVGNVIQDLLKEKFIIRTNNKVYQFGDRKRLFDEWVREYNNNLRPKLKQRTYRWLNKKPNWKNIKLPSETYWGGVNAAEILTDHIIADRIHLYTGLPFQDVMKSMKIVPDDNGDITITEVFWENGGDTNDLIDPILVYADLQYDTNPRYIETASKIYKEYVQDKL